MCLAVPSKIVKIENQLGVIDVEGVTRETNLVLIEDARVGDYVIVHAGFAIRKIDEAEALESLKILREGAAMGFDG
ncbi:MAG: HypC/HybG/HupF family hydrogenase formation chaperone [Thermodesulfobacteriota bacterium]